MDPMAYESETASPDAFSEDSSCSTPSSGGSSNQLDNRLQVVIWLKEHYRVGEAGSMRKSFVYQHYLDACRESGMEGAPISHTFFGKLVRRAFPGIKCNRKGPRGDAHQCYTHLERLPTAQRLGAWQVEQITEELSKCSSSGSPAGSRLSPLRPKTSPRPRDTHGDDEDPSTPTSDDHVHHHHHQQQQQQHRRHHHPIQHAHQGRQCFSSCCSPLSSPPTAFSTSASTSSSFSSSPRSSCCAEGLEEGEFHQEGALSCCSGHHHHRHPSHYHPSSSGDDSYESYDQPDEQLSLQQHYMPDLAYAAPAFLSYPPYYGHPATYSYSPCAPDYRAQQQQQQQQQQHLFHPHHQLGVQPSSPTFDLPTTGEEEVEEEFGTGNVNALTSPLQGNGMALTFADYLTACQTARQQQHLQASATIAEGEFETNRGEDASTSWVAASTDGCSRTVEPLALSWASAAWSDAIY